MVGVLESAKGSLEAATDLSKSSGEEAVAGNIQSALDTLMRNERKIWLKTKKGREMLSAIEEAAESLQKAVEEGVGVDEALVAVEEKVRLLEAEIRRRSMVVT